MKQHAIKQFLTNSKFNTLKAEAYRRLGSDDAGTGVESALFEDCFECLSPHHIPA